MSAVGFGGLERLFQMRGIGIIICIVLFVVEYTEEFLFGVLLSRSKKENMTVDGI